MVRSGEAIAQQKRIAAKVEQLTILCDNLEGKLQQAQGHARQPPYRHRPRVDFTERRAE